MKMNEFDEIMVMLVDDIIKNISKLQCVSKYESMKLFYTSPICKMLYQKNTGLYTQSAASIAYRCIN